MTMAGSEKIWNGAKTDFLRPLILSVPLGPEARSQKRVAFHSTKNSEISEWERMVRKFPWEKIQTIRKS